MKAGRKFLLALVCLLLFSTQATADVHKYKRHVVIDKQGMGIEAFRLLIPDSWRFQGGVRWLTNSFQLTQTAFTVSSPDDEAAFEIFPEMLFFFSADPNMNAIYAQHVMVHQPVDAATYLQQMFIPTYRGNMPGLRIVSGQQLPQLAQKEMANYQYQVANNPYIAQLAAQSRFQFDAASVTIEYKSAGKLMEETLSAVLSYSSTGFITNWGPVRQTSLRSVKASKAKMTPLLKVICDSFEMNPVWEYKMSQIYYFMVQQQKKVIASIGELSRYISQTNDQINDMLYQSYRQSDAIYDQMSENWSEAIRGVDSYHDPINGVNVEAPTVYESGWTDGNEYLFSTDPSFEPNRTSGPNWTRLEKRR